MSRRGDNAPVGHTCLDIDEAQSIANNVISSIDASLGSFNEAKTYLSNLIFQLEFLRNENSKLRDWGNEYYNKCENLEDELKNMEYEKDRYKEEVDDLKSECRSLQDEINERENEISSLHYELDRRSDTQAR